MSFALFPHSRLLKKTFPTPYFVAPMVGLTHVAMRELVDSYTKNKLPVVRYTEMLSTRRIPNENIKKVHELKSTGEEANLVIQILGNEERQIRESIKKLESIQPIAIDINMGCPVTHTLKHNWGVRLMGDAPYAARVVEWTKKHSPFPVSVKFRGSDSDTMSLAELDDFTRHLEEAGADWLTIHPRSKTQGHKGIPNYELAAQLRQKRNIPLILNGDIQTAQDIKDIAQKYELDGIMVGRAITARPWLFSQLMSAPADEESGQSYYQACLLLLELMEKHFGDETYILEKFKFFVATGSKWFTFGHAFWKLCTKAKTLEELKNLIGNFFQNSAHPMVQRVQFL